jgi:arylsulfatase A-like enzyme
MLPAFLGETSHSLRSTMITQSNIGPIAIRHNEWKLIVDTTGSGGPKTPSAQPTIITQPWQGSPSRVGQLYNIERDPYEQHDLWNKHPEKVEELRLMLKEQIWTGRSR